MSDTTRAAVVREPGGSFEVIEIRLDPPAAGEVEVRILATGVCHSDLSIQQGVIPATFPVVLGHEAVAEVEIVGPEVAGLEPGDRVVLSWIPQCGRCDYCRRGEPQLCETSSGTMLGRQPDGSLRRYLPDGSPLYAMTALGTFAERAVVPASAAVPVSSELPAEQVALLGCGVLTGVGAVLNTAQVEPGSAVAVLGVGGVGLNVVQGARIAGASAIVAVDLNESKLELARHLGASHTVRPDVDDPRRTVREVTGGSGVDYAFEVIGRPETARTAFELIRPGGLAVMVGVPDVAAELKIPLMMMVTQERRVAGSLYGSSDVRRDVPRMLDLYAAGELDLASLVTGTAGLEDLDDAAARLAGGEAVRTVITP